MADQPNILIILSDQLRRNALGLYGNSDIATPNCDFLGSKGVVFKNACSSYPVCVPFRFTLMTGHYAHSRAVPAIEYRMSPSERTLADEFNDAGYETVYIGKWHLYGSLARKPLNSLEIISRTPVPALYRGRWQKWYGFDFCNNHSETLYFVDDEVTPRRLDTYQTDGLFDVAIEHLTERTDSEQPFIMVISVEAPHPPYQAPDELTRKWMARNIQLPPNFDTPDETTRFHRIKQRKIYNAMVENLDYNIGRMNLFLEERGLAENTVKIVLADHGEMGGSHGKIAKQHPFEESVGIPLIISDPRYSGARSNWIDDPVCTEDLFPTLLGLAGLSPKNAVPGQNLAPLIWGKQDRLGREGVLLEFVAEHRPQMPYHNQTWRGYRTRRYKYTVLGGASGGHPWQFFDLQQDPFEMVNLINAPLVASEVAQHHGLLRAALVDSQDHYLLAPAFGFESLNIPDMLS